MKRFLTIVLVCRDEHLYVEEWIAHHKAIGADHFFVYDNRSDPPMRDFLADDVRSGLVTVVNWAGDFDCHYQCSAYQDFLTRYGFTTRWACDLDVDEFIYPKHEPLVDLLSEFEGYAGLSINWQIFGPNGNVERPICAVVDAYITRAPWDHPGHRIGKTIYQPKFIKLAKLHIPTPIPGQLVVGEMHRAATEDPRDISVERIQVNHYYTKSEVEWRTGKMAKDSWKPPRKTFERFERWREMAIVEDTGLRDLVWARRMR